MKRLTVLLIAGILCFALSGCGAGDVGSAEYMAQKQRESEAAANANSESEPSWSADFAGLTGCFEWRGYVIPDSKTETLASVIGATEGYRYRSQVGKSQFNVELYSFDPSNLDETASSIINEIEETGKFTMIDSEIQAEVSNNRKYMMIYTDPSSDEFNITMKQTVTETLLLFP